MKELVSKVSEFKGKPVTFVSLSIAGKSSGELPSPQFLKEWKSQFNIPFVVAASPKNPGKEFYEQPRIPNMVVVDQGGKLAFKKIHAAVDEVFQKVRSLLSEDE